MKILTVDIGGTNVKLLATGQTEPTKFPSGPQLTPAQMVDKIREITATWSYDAVSIGYPGPIGEGRILLEPKNLGQGWVPFDFERALERPVKLMNDAAMQALGSYERGRMLFLGLGTGLGSALIVDGMVIGLELAHLPYRKRRSFEDYVGQRGLDEFGKKKWREHVHDVVTRLKNALVADYVVLGGGNIKQLKEIPTVARLGDNRNAFLGGFRMWRAPKDWETIGVTPILHSQLPVA